MPDRGTPVAVYNGVILGYYLTLIGLLKERIYDSDSTLGLGKLFCPPQPCGFPHQPPSPQPEKEESGLPFPRTGERRWALEREHYVGNKLYRAN
jgi:hypothetical protein